MNTCSTRLVAFQDRVAVYRLFIPNSSIDLVFDKELVNFAH